MSIAPKFTVYCALTCLGGSEKKQCLCTCPRDCELQRDPAFQHARNEAIARMGRFINNVLLRRRP